MIMHIKNEIILLPLLRQFNRLILSNSTLTDKTGIQYAEVINYNVALNPGQPILDFNGARKTPIAYCAAELEWYNSQDLDITEISKHAEMWKSVASPKTNKVNSNYGYLVFSKENCNQFGNLITELKANPDTRRGVIIYNRPSIWKDYKQDGMNDFICTMYTNHVIRNNMLVSNVKMRSNDFIFGFFNDFFWQCYVHRLIHEALLDTYPDLEFGVMNWTADSMHIYERHFKLLKKMITAMEKDNNDKSSY